LFKDLAGAFAHVPGIVRPLNIIDEPFQIGTGQYGCRYDWFSHQPDLPSVYPNRVVFPIFINIPLHSFPAFSFAAKHAAA
jgi:hypothetical protein